MFENFKLFRNWYSLARPNKKYWSISCFAVILAYVCVILEPIFSAKIVVCITDGKFLNAVTYLTIVFMLLALRNIFWHINYFVFNKLVGSIYGRINNMFVDKMLNAKSSNFLKTPKETLINIVHSDVYNLADTADRFAICTGRLFMLIITTIILFVINPLIGGAVVIAIIVNFLLLNKLENRRSKCVKKTCEDKDEQYKKFSEIIDYRDTINDLSLNREIKKQYNKHIDTYIHDLGKQTVASSSISQGVFVFYNFLIFILTLGVVGLVAGWFTGKSSLSIEMYFIIVPYITKSIETTNQVFEFMQYLKNSGIYASRIKNVLNFVEKDKLQYGDVNTDDIIGYMDFDEVCFKGDNEGNPVLEDINLHIKGLQTTLIVGEKSSGKRSIFHLMHRKIKATSGEISMDGLNILEYSDKVFGKNFNYLSTRPTFFNTSIMQNLKMINKNTKLIKGTLTQLGLMEYINTLPQKLESNILTLPFEKQYLLGLARVILTGSEIISIYEFPVKLTQKEINNIKQVLSSLQGKRTIIMFSVNDTFSDIADKVVYIANGKVQDITFTNSRQFIGWVKDDLKATKSE